MEQARLDFDPELGARLRDQGVRDVTAHRAERMSVIHEALRALAARREFLTCDDLRDAVPPEHWPDHPNAWGAALRNGAAAGLVEAAGPMEPSGIPTNRGRRLLVWRSLLYRSGERGAA